MVVKHPIDTPLFTFAVRPVYIIDHRAEHNRIGHLSGYWPGLHFAAAQKLAQFSDQQLLDFSDKIGALIVEHLGLFKGFDPLMLTVAAYRIHDGQHARDGGRRLLRRNKIDTVLLAPAGVGDGLGNQRVYFFNNRLPRGARIGFGRVCGQVDRPRKGRGLAP